jgi:hypothetical protein
MTEALPASQAYLLRLWQASNAGTPVWRVSIVNVHTGERHGFADLDSLLLFLKEQTSGDARPSHDRPSTAP